MKYLPIIRKVCQLSILALFCALPFLAALGFTGISGSLFSLDVFGLPFADPASTMQIVGQSALLGVYPLTLILLGATLSLLLAFFMGRIFCGWICPYGLFSEFAAKRKKTGKHAIKIKTGIFIAALVLATLTGYPLIGLLSMPGQISLAPMTWRNDWNIALLILLPPFLALIMDLLLGRRFFCSYICPQSVLLGASASLLPKTFPGLRINWQKDKCSCKGAPCEKACQFALTPRKNLQRDACAMCGTCVAVCSKKGGALNFSFKNPD